MPRQPFLHRRMLPLAAGILLACAFALTACGGGSDNAAPPQVQTSAGLVEGTDTVAASGTQEWLGIPYAKPPVGALRWMPPEPVAAWTGVRPARQFGASCAQGGRFFSPAPDNAPFSLAVRDGFGKPVGSEDCLTLNIWRPAQAAGGAAAKLPVIVFIHGGSNISGYTADPLYNGRLLAAKANAVVVTVNYRLGIFGWLDMPQLKTGEAVADSGNFATLDQIQALKFVNANIEAFGGDKGNVTVMGESAGSVNVWALMVSPLTEGLMHKAVSMSGGLLTATPVQAKVYANNFLAKLLVADGKAADVVAAQLYLLGKTPAEIASYVRSKTAAEIINVSLDASLGSAPAVISDGTVLPLVPNAALATGAYRRVPMLAGNMAEEGKLFGGAVGAYKPSEYDRFSMQYNFNPDAAPTLTEGDLLNPTFLPVDKPVTGWNTVAFGLTTAVFTAAGNATLASYAVHQPSQLWYYRMDWNEEPAPFNTVYGAVHAMDVPFMFGTFDPKSVFSFAFSQANKPGRVALSDAMMASLGAFARTGNPNTAALGVTWPNWPSKIVFDASATQAQIRTE